jgi:hypothetical protein
MSRLISKLLGASEPAFSMALKQLEQITNRQGIDVRLTAEISNKVRYAVGQFGLDPYDTTAKELYHCLMNKIKVDDERFVRLIGGQPGGNPTDLVEPVIKNLDNLNLSKKCWVIKKSVAKELLRRNPPKNVMKQLRYKSIDSMLKNENIYELFGAIRFAETIAWQKKLIKSYKVLGPSDFEVRNIEVFVMPEDRWQQLSHPAVKAKGHFVTNLKELGAIIVLPPAHQNQTGYATLLALLIIHYINEIRTYSSFFKLHQVKPDFASIMSGALIHDRAHVAIVGGHPIHWRAVQRHYGKQINNQPQTFEPLIQWEDLQWHIAEKTLAKIDQDYSWWCDLDYVGLINTKNTVSLSLMDVVNNCYLGKEYEQASSSFLKLNLWNELFARYMGEKVVEQQVVRQLDIEMLETEMLFENFDMENI